MAVDHAGSNNAAARLAQIVCFEREPMRVTDSPLKGVRGRLPANKSNMLYLPRYQKHRANRGV
jgi:hypothetical protein